jgi:hypothetical protein
VLDSCGSTEARFGSSLLTMSALIRFVAQHGDGQTLPRFGVLNAGEGAAELGCAPSWPHLAER